MDRVEQLVSYFKNNKSKKRKRLQMVVKPAVVKKSCEAKTDKPMVNIIKPAVVKKSCESKTDNPRVKTSKVAAHKLLKRWKK